MEIKQTILQRIKSHFMGQNMTVMENTKDMNTTVTEGTDHTTDMMPQQTTQPTMPQSKSLPNGSSSASKKQPKRKRKSKALRLDPMSKWSEEEIKLYRHLKYLQKKRAFKEQGLTARGEVPVRNRNKNFDTMPKRVKQDVDYRWYWCNFLYKERAGRWQKRYNKLYSEAVESGRKYGDFVARTYRCLEKYGSEEQKQKFKSLMNDMMSDLQK